MSRRIVLVLALPGLLLGVLLAGLVAVPAPPASASITCSTLTRADLSFAAPLLTGSTTTAKCWTLPSATGEELKLGALNAGAQVLDKLNATVCSPDSFGCLLAGQAPYRLVVPAGSTHYQVQLASVTDAQGCQALPVTGFDGAVPASGHAVVAYPASECTRGSLAAGSYVVTASVEAWGLFDATGHLLCYDDGEPCTLTRATDVTIVLAGSRPAGPIDHVVVPLASATAGCGTISSDWSVAPTTISIGAAPAVHCQQIAAPNPDTVLVSKDLPQDPPTRPSRAGLVDTVVVGASGAPAARGARRLISWVAASDANDLGYDRYRLAVGDLTDPVGCPSIAPRSYGLLTAAVSADSCRELVPATSGTHLLDTDDVRGLSVVDAGGDTVCGRREACELTKGTPYVLLLGSLAATSTVSFQRLDAPGCTTLAATPEVTATGPSSALGCAQLPYPRDAVVSLLAPALSQKREVKVFDGHGVELCDDVLPTVQESCTLDGSTPFRVIVAKPTFGSEDFHLAVDRLDKQSGCVPLKLGAYGTSDGVDLSVDADSFARCFTLTGPETLGRAGYAAESTSGTRHGQGRLWVVGGQDTEHGSGCDFAVTGVGYGVCDASASSDHQVLFTAQSGGDFRLALRSITGDPSCVPLTAAQLHGASISGSMGDFVDQDCYLVDGAHLDRFAVQVAGAADTTAQLFVHQVGPASTDWLCQAYREPCLLTQDAPEYQVVVAQHWDPAALDYATAYSLTALRYRSSAGWDPSCYRKPTSYADGFGPLTESLTPGRPLACIVVPENGAQTVVDTGAVGPSVLVTGISTAAPSTADCSQGFAGYQVRCQGLGARVGDEGLVLLGLRDGTAKRFDVSGACLGATTCKPHPLVLRTAPTTKGSPVVGQTVSVASYGTWTPDPLAPDASPTHHSGLFAVVWLLDGKPVASGPSVKVRPGFAGKKLAARVTARRPYFAAGIATTTAVTVRPAS